MAGAGAAFLWDPKMPTFVPAGGFEAQAAAREEQRNEALEAAKAEFFEKQRRLRAVEARQAQTGEGVWVAPAVASRLDAAAAAVEGGSAGGTREPTESWVDPSADDSSHHKRKRAKEKKSKSHKDGKKGKKDKKEKKDKKREKKRHKKELKAASRAVPAASDSDSSDSDDDPSEPTAAAAEWVEAGAAAPQPRGSDNRDDWMMAGDADPFASLMGGGGGGGGVSGADRQRQREADKAAAAATAAAQREKQLGQSSRELNPYWKDGGTGAPPSPRSQPSDRASGGSSGGGGGGWRARIKQRSAGAGEASSRNPRAARTADDAPRRSAPEEDVPDDLRGRMRRPGQGDPTRRGRGDSDDASRGFLPSGGTARPDDSSAGRPRSGSPPGRGESTAGSGGGAALLNPTRGDVQSTGSPLLDHLPVLTEEELNTMAADLMRAELMGDDDEAEALKAKLAAAQARKAEARTGDSGGGGGSGRGGVSADSAEMEGDGETRAELLMRVNRRGMAMPVKSSGPARERQAITGKVRRVKEKADTHVDGERARYFADDDANADVRSMLEKERMGVDDDPDAVFRNYHSKFLEKTDDDDYTMDDMYVDRVGRKQAAGKQESRERSRAVASQQRRNTAMDRDEFLFENFFKANKHLVASLGRKIYMCLPPRGSLAEGHVLLVPVRHVTACTALDEDEWAEVQRFQQCLVAMWKSEGKDTVFMESVMGLKRQPHTVVHCVPLDGEEAEFAPMYFKKAIQDSDEQWAQHKKVIDTKAKGLRRSVPQGFPYFSVEFGLDGGFAHVIEDEAQFPKYFGQEIIGSILGLTPNTWLKPPREHFEDQKRKALAFTTKWSKWDWTATIE